MINTHFKIGFRNILKNRGFFALNAGGLIVGLTAVLLISLWVGSELNYNKSVTNYNSVAAIMQKQTIAGEVKTYTGLPMQLSPVLRKEYGNHFKHIAMSSRIRNYNIKYNGDMQMVRGRFAEPDYAQILDLKMIVGSRDALQDISSVLISESTSKNIFGNEDPMGKAIKINSTMDVKVAGVYEDLPQNSSFRNVKFIAPWDLLKKSANYEKRLGWGNYWFQVYVQLNDEHSLENAATAIKDVFNENYINKSKERDYQLFLFPLSKWHLYSKFENGVSVGGRIEYVRIFSIIGIFILLLACINFMNLSTANALKRSKEVGVRKTLGSSRKQLIFQFFTESFMIILFSFVVALVFTFLLLPQYNTITLKDIVIPFGEPSFWLVCFLLLGVTAVLSSLYPSIYLSAFNPVTVLKGLSSNNKTAVNLRKVLIVVQFAISGILIMGTLTVIEQIDHAKNRPIGFNKDLLVSVPMNNNKVLQSFDVIKSELLESTFINQVTASDVKITAAYTTNGGSFEWKNKDPKLRPEFYTIRATLGFGKMVDWKVLQGRDFSAKFPSDTLAFLVNETAVKYMGLENPVGEYVRWGDNGNYKIVGVVKDMVTRSPFDPITPSLFILHNGRFLNYVNIKIASNNTGAVEGAMDKIKTVFQKHDPGNIFRYSFMDEEYERKFNAERRIAKLVGWFSLVAIFISCLGVLGLSTYMAIQRRKEIGIRKVLGASVSTIWQLLSKQFVILILISLVIALPIGYYFSSQWLLEYSYRIQIGFWIFALSSGFILIVTLLTVSYQAIKSATSNPVNSIRTE
ncbi:FtsX-like permease family protein [Flavobacteriaceae bacterium S356]|uniref:FtsX-like permease family protein n=1 Tax=Asprobacillus argus TaxID=3076534 RepID=A0ABU3LC42_9FLAO|nr:FtsX-like permease family protein [Flavobacteriaceae bacterium S356]